MSKTKPSSISLKTLGEILRRETSCIAGEDVAGLMRTIRKAACKKGSQRRERRDA